MRWVGRFLSCSLILACGMATSQAQPERLELVHADELAGERSPLGTVRRLDGHVVFRQGEATMRCDHAIQYLEEDRVVFIGNVELARCGQTLRADRVTYLAREREEWAEGHVVVLDSARELRAGNLHYREGPEVGWATGSVVLRHLRTRAVLQADTVVYYRARGVAEGHGSPRIVQEDSTGVPVFTLTGRTVRWLDDSRLFQAEGQVRIEQAGSWATCDSLHFWRSKNVAVLTGNPTTWRRWERMTGERMEWHFAQDSLREVHVWGKATVVSEGDTLRPGTRQNRVQGDTIRIFFASGDPRQVEVEGRATALYYVFEKTEPKGANWVLGDRIRAWIENGRVERMEVIGAPEAAEGKYYPERIVSLARQESVVPERPLPSRERGL
jgi:lipopolysaccharide export system protein LptA